jgi:hypothetical protein
MMNTSKNRVKHVLPLYPNSDQSISGRSFDFLPN